MAARKKAKGPAYRKKYTDAIRAQKRAWYTANRVAVLARQKARLLAQPGKRTERARKRTLKIYGLNVASFDAMVVSQAGLCAICGKPEVGIGRSGVINPLSIDHDHSTGRIRALLCRHCNAALGLLHDDPSLLRAAASYLESHACVEVPS